MRRAFPLLLIGLLALAGCQAPPPVAPLPLEGEQLARNYWSMPVAAQVSRVSPPRDATLHPLSASRCGRCHESQYKQWSTTIHAAAIGPGIKARTFNHSEVGKTSCYLCHAPLAEQHAWRDDRPFARDPQVPDEVWNWFQKKRDAYVARDVKLIDNADFSAPLQEEGLTCAACHVRDGVTYASPSKRRIDALPDDEGFHKAGIVRTPYLSSAEFCRDCHQFYEKKPARGKAIQNTYVEWRHSVFGKSGVTCQACHMPGGAHLWRGIHDKAQVSSALACRLEVGPKAGEPGRFIGALRVTNQGVGHSFPTYVTPRAIARIVLHDATGAEISGTARDWYIARSVDLRKLKEHYDMRIGPQDTWTIGYDATVAQGVVVSAVSARITVEPDHDYLLKYQDALLKPKLEPAHRELLEAALTRAKSSPFVAYETKVPIIDLASTERDGSIP